MKRIITLSVSAVLGLAAVLPQMAMAEERFRGLPEGYMQVEHLHSGSAQRIDTGVATVVGVSAVLDYAPDGFCGNAHLGSLYGSDSHEWRFAPYMKGVFFDLGDSRAGKPNQSDAYVWPNGERHKIWLRAENNKAVYTIYNADGSIVDTQTASAEVGTLAESTIGIFGGINSTQEPMKVWSLVMEVDGVLTRDFVPAKCVKSGDANEGKYGLYDLVENKFYVPSTDFDASIQGTEVVGMDIASSVLYDESTAKWTLSCDVACGNGDLYATITDADNVRTEYLMKLAAEPGDELTHVFDSLAANENYTIGYKRVCKNVAGETVTDYITVSSIFNGMVSLAAAGDADEGDGRIGGFTISRAEGDSGETPLTINYSVGGTAKSGVTYVALSGSATIPAGVRSVKIEVVPLYDAMITEDSTVVLTLLPGPYLLDPEKREATIKVVNGESYGAWVFTPTSSGSNSGTLRDNRGWVFDATIVRATGAMTVGAVHRTAGEVPTEIAPLDFSKFIISSESTDRYFVQTLNPKFGSGQKGLAPVNYLLGKLTFPGEGLTTLGTDAFCDCTNATGLVTLPSTMTTILTKACINCTFVVDGESFPAGVTYIKDNILRGVKFKGYLNLTNVTVVEGYAFAESDVTEVRFGPGLTDIQGGYYSGAFIRCTSLTNLFFHPDSRFTVQQTVFNGCTALTEVDFCGMTTNNAGSMDIFSGCTSLRKVTFGPAFDCFKGQMFSDCSALETVRFCGPPPSGFVTPWLAYHGNRKITTEVPMKLRAKKNSAGKCWNDCSCTGKIRREGTTWSWDYLQYGVSLENRPLVGFGPGEGLLLTVR